MPPPDIERIEQLALAVEQWKEEPLRETARELVKAVLSLHASGLERILSLVGAKGDCGSEILAACAADELVASLLMLHNLHPRNLSERVEEALESVRPYLHSHGGNVELLAIDEGVVRLRLQGSCHGCPSSAATLKDSIERAILAAAPDVAAIEVDQPDAQQPHDLLQISTV
jgi:Fe-S cluster biogenesis protein NfuA